MLTRQQIQQKQRTTEDLAKVGRKESKKESRKGPRKEIISGKAVSRQITKKSNVNYQVQLPNFNFFKGGKTQK